MAAQERAKIVVGYAGPGCATSETTPAGRFAAALTGAFCAAVMLCCFHVLERASVGRSVNTRADLRVLAKAVKQFHDDTGRLPTEKEGFKSLYIRPPQLAGWNGPYIRCTPIDAWAREYAYCLDDRSSSGFRVVALEKDGVEGTADDLMIFGEEQP